MKLRISAIVSVAIALFIIIFSAGFSVFLKIYAATRRANYGAGAAVVLGCKANETAPSRSLQYRLDKALEYSVKNTRALIVVSGGQGKDETRPEADVMAEWLVNSGVSAERIIIESNSHSTKDNIEFSKRALSDRLGHMPTITIITSDYHIFRAVRLAEASGFIVSALPAKTPPRSVPWLYIRECLAIIKLGLFDVLSG